MEVWKEIERSEEVFCLASAPSGYVASAGDAGVKVWSAEGKVVHRISRPLVSIATNVAFFNKRSDALLVASGTDVLSFDLRNLSAPDSVFPVGDSGEELNDLGISERDQFAAACDDAGVVRVFDLRANCLFKTMQRQHANICSSLAFRPQRPWQIVSVGLDCRLVRWDFSRGRPLQVIHFDQACVSDHAETEAGGSPVGASSMINPPMLHQVDFHHRGDWLILAGGDSCVRLLHAPSRSPLAEVLKCDSVHESSVSQAQFTHFAPDKLALSGGNDARVVLWNFEDYLLGKANSKSTTAPTHPGVRSSSISQHPAAVRTWQHSSKINWLASGWDPSDGRIFVADQSSNISVYRVDQ